MNLIEEVGDGEWLIRGQLRRSCAESEHIDLTEYGPDYMRWRDTEPLADLAEEFNGKCVTIRYWISDEPLESVEVADELLAHLALGGVDSKYNAHYSDRTGFLWCDEDFKVGGHDLIEAIAPHVDKYLLMEVLVHNGVSELEYYPWL